MTLFSPTIWEEKSPPIGKGLTSQRNKLIFFKTIMVAGGFKEILFEGQMGSFERNRLWNDKSLFLKIWLETGKDIFDPNWEKKCLCLETGTLMLND